MNSAEGFALIITLWRHKKSLKLVYAKTLSAKTLKLVLAILRSTHARLLVILSDGSARHGLTMVYMSIKPISPALVYA